MLQPVMVGWSLARSAAELTMFGGLVSVVVGRYQVCVRSPGRPSMPRCAKMAGGENSLQFPVLPLRCETHSNVWVSSSPVGSSVQFGGV